MIGVNPVFVIYIYSFFFSSIKYVKRNTLSDSPLIPPSNQSPCSPSFSSNQTYIGADQASPSASSKSSSSSQYYNSFLSPTAEHPIASSTVIQPPPSVRLYENFEVKTNTATQVDENDHAHQQHQPQSKPLKKSKPLI